MVGGVTYVRCAACVNKSLGVGYTPSPGSEPLPPAVSSAVGHVSHQQQRDLVPPMGSEGAQPSAP